MILRSILAWFAILVLAIGNGALRQGLLVPSMGENAARAISSIVLSTLVAIATWIALPRIAPASSREAWAIGAIWTAMTLAFEFLAGHYLFGNSWEKLLADYDLSAGRIWILVLIVTLVAPAVVYALQHRGAHGQPALG